MPRPHITWQPLFLTEPESFARLLEEPSLDRRLRSWRGYEDMLLGEALRAGLHDDRAARTSLEELYAFGLANGLPLWSRREAVRALRAYAGRYPLPGSTWGPFLRLDPDWQVALTAASAWLESEDTQAASALLKALEEERLAIGAVSSVRCSATASSRRCGASGKGWRRASWRTWPPVAAGACPPR
ncbi:hypothetical protein NF552_09860 [Roseomonas mucosa]|nr:hypothetical protein NF552_09860 [Roseomonas mucosa]